MANCIYCGTETVLYEMCVPICLACSNDLEAGRAPSPAPRETRTDGPLKGDRFRMVVPTLGIREENEDRIPTTIPTGSLITVLTSADAETLIGVEWEGYALRMYVHDLREHGEIVISARADV